MRDAFLRAILDDPDNDTPRLVQGWTKDRDLVMRQLRKQYPAGGTAMNDTVADAIPYAQRGHNPKKAIVIISDGNDNKSATPVTELRSLIRETTGRVGSSADKAGTAWYCQTSWVRRARSDGIRQEPVVKAP